MCKEEAVNVPQNDCKTKRKLERVIGDNLGSLRLCAGDDTSRRVRFDAASQAVRGRSGVARPDKGGHHVLLLDAGHPKRLGQPRQVVQKWRGKLLSAGEVGRVCGAACLVLRQDISRFRMAPFCTV